MSPKKVPHVKFIDGQTFPVFGLGTWKSQPGEVSQAVKDSIDIGYRHIDCAYLYLNEKEIGEAIATKIAEGVVKREDLYITSKLWNTSHRPDLVQPALEITLRDLRLDYLDLYLIHWPFALKEGDDHFPEELSKVDYVDTWKAMEGLRKKGLTKSIGVSNFNKRQLERLLKETSIVPVTNQVECHPYLNQIKLSSFCKSKGIVVTAYSPLGSPDRPWAKPTDPQPLQDSKVKEIGQKYGKSPGQVLIRYQVQRGHIVIPKSVTKSRIAQNFDIWDFELSSQDMEALNSLDCNARACGQVEYAHHPDHPFTNDEF